MPVVVGFDGSERSRLAVFWAAREAAERAVPLTIVNVLHGTFPELVFTPMSVPLPEIVGEEAVRKYSENKLDEVARECRLVAPDVEVRTHLAHGRPAEVVTGCAEDADLLVLGASGHSGMTRVLLGSTAATVVHDHAGPTVVARDDKTDGRVVVGVDGSPTSSAAIEFAFEFAARHGNALVAVHAWSDLPIDALMPVREWDYDWHQVRQQAEDVISESLAEWQQRYPSVHMERVVSFDAPARALLDQAKDAALVVVGSHGRGAVRRALIGSVSHAVLYHAPCSVAVVRPHA
jgi:nucleotide-binding universal stress UspA family protein